MAPRRWLNRMLGFRFDGSDASCAYSKRANKPWTSVRRLSMEPLEQRTLLSTYYVSGDALGSDSHTLQEAQNIGTPWKSIQHAADIMVAGDTCLIRGGTYRETVMVANSGSTGNPITFQAYNNETVTISGAEAITGWTLDSGTIYRAGMNWTLDDANQVFVGGTMAPEAQWPNVTSAVYPWRDSSIEDSSDWSYVDNVDVDNTNHVWFTDSDLPDRPDDYWVGSTVNIMVGIGVTMRSFTVTDYDNATKMITTDAIPFTSVWDITVRNEYYLVGKASNTELDSSCEWYYTGSQLYINSPSGAPTGVEAKKRDTGFDLSGKSDVQLIGLHLYACNIKTDASSTDCVFDGLQMLYVEHNRKSNVKFSNPSIDNGYGGSLVLYDGSVLRNSELAFGYSSLVTLAGSNIKIINNHLHDGNYIPGWSLMVNQIPVSAADAYNLISHNTIHDSGNALVGSQPGAQVAGGLIVEYNNLYYGVRLTTDYGAFNVYQSEGERSVVRYNLIHDTSGAAGHYGYNVAAGIYLDGGLDYNWTIHHNIIWNVSGAGFLINSGEGYPRGFVDISNNTIWDDADDLLPDLANTNQGENIYVCNNLFYAQPAPIGDDTTICGYNLQANSSYYVNAANGDFHLSASSPARNAGCVVSGITDGYLETAPDIGALEYGGYDWTQECGYHATPPSPDPTYTPPDTSLSNRVQNGGFAAGDLASWSTTGSVSVVTWGSNYAVRLGSGTSELYQTIENLLPDTRYQLYCRLMGTASAITLGVRGNTSGTDLAIAPTLNANDWATNVLTFLTGPTTTSVQIYLNTTTTGFVQADNWGVVPLSPYTSPVNDAPVCTISNNPVVIATGGAATTGTIVTLTATVSDSVGGLKAVNPVSFFVDGNFIGYGALNDGVWSCTWDVSAMGYAGYAITAQATDLYNVTTTSATLGMLVLAGPTDQAAEVGQTVTFNVHTGDVAATYLWQRSTDGGANWSDAPGTNTNASYTTPTIVSGDNGTLYRVTVTTSYGSATSSSVTLSVTLTPPLPVHQYTFDSDATDSVGGVDGTLGGSASISGGSLHLNAATGDYLSIDGSAIAGLTDATFEIWGTYATSNHIAARLFEFSDGINYYFDGSVGFGEFMSPPAYDDYTTYTANTGTPTFVAITISGTTLSTYLNGVYQGSVTAHAGLSDISSPYGFLGCSFWGSFLTGSIDEFRIYNQVLSAETIAQQVKSLVAHWKFDETSGTTVADSSGNGNIATLQNSATLGGAGQISGAVTLDGNTGHLTVPDSSALEYTGGDMTISTWVWIDPSESGSGAILSKPWNINGEYNYLLGIMGTTHSPYFWLQNNTYCWAGIQSWGGGMPLSTGAWHHLAVTVVGSSNLITLYVDGAAVGTAVHTVSSWTPEYGNEDRPLLIGKVRDDIVGQDYCFDGKIDELRIYKQVLSAETIAKQAKSLVAHWKFDETSGTTVADSSGNGNIATLQKDATLGGAGQISGAVTLDGNTDHLTVPDSSALEYTGGDMTISTWVWIDPSESGDGAILSKPWNINGEYNYLLGITGTTHSPYFWLQNNTYCWAGIQSWGGSMPLSTGAWHHLAVAVVGSSNLITLYVDGAAVGTAVHTVSSWTPEYGNEDRPLLIGTVRDDIVGQNYFFGGKIDDTQIYRTVLTADHIYRLALQVNCPPTVGITAPLADAVFASPASYTITANASDADGVSKVDFYQDGILLGSDTNGADGWSWLWGNAHPGDHTLQAIATDIVGNTAASAVIPITVAPSAPTGLSATAASASQVNLSWTAPSGTIDGYNVYRGTSAGNEDYNNPINGGTLIATTSFSDTTANANTAYYYTVKAVSNAVSSVASSEAVALTMPAAPTGLSAAASASSSELNLTWTAPSGTVSGYNIYRGTSAGGEDYNNPINGASLVTATTYSDTGRTAGTTYYYTVKAINASGSSVASTEASATTSAAITVPSNLVAYWRLDEASSGSGGTTYDIATAGSATDNGTVNNATWTAGTIGNALQFGTGKYVSVANSADLQITSQLTIACWAKAPVNSNWIVGDAFVSKANSYSLGAVVGSKNIRFGVKIGSTWYYATSNVDASFDNSQWHHYVGTFDGSVLRVYVDAGTPTTTSKTGTIATSTNALYLGRNTSGTSYGGSLDEVRIYNIAQSASNILTLYNQTALGVTNLSPTYATVQPYALKVGASPYQYSDMNYTFSSSTTMNQFIGSTFIQTRNADRLSMDNQLIGITTNAPCVAYVLYDTAITGSNRAGWLSDFTDTGLTVTNSNGHTFRLYSKVLSTGTLWLGGNLAAGATDQGGQMYSLLLCPLCWNSSTNQTV